MGANQFIINQQPILQITWLVTITDAKLFEIAAAKV
jgi:hypothetical protein